MNLLGIGKIHLGLQNFSPRFSTILLISTVKIGYSLIVSRFDTLW